MFDLPMDDTVAVRNYTQFRKLLLRQGYFMIQYSIYCKIMPNRDSVKSHIEYIKRYFSQIIHNVMIFSIHKYFIQHYTYLFDI